MRRLRWSPPILVAVVSLAVCRLAFADEPPPAPPPPAAVTEVPPAPPPPAEPAPPPPPPMFAPPPPLAPPPPAASKAMLPVAAPLKVDSATTTIKLGLLLQPQYEALGSNVLNSTAQNLYLRRVRLLLGGTLFGVVDYFVDTDFPNLFKAVNVGTAAAPVYVKNTPGLNIQDVFATYKPIGDLLKIDVGYTLPAMSHNSLQGAGTMLGWDYFANTFQHTNAFGSQNPPGPVGRDFGVQLRGLVLDGHLEYRAGLWQGLRDQQTATEVASRNFFRFAGRIQINLLDPEPGYFYAGTYFGARKIASIGGSYDIQDKYHFFDVDGILDMPLGPGVVTAQVDYSHWHGGTSIPALPDQSAIAGEGGYTFADVKVSPIVRIEHLWIAGANNDQSRYAGGVAFWPFGHSSNVKLFYTRILVQNAPHGANQVNLQWQVYFF